MCGAGGPEPSESCFHLSKGHTGLDSYQVRTRISWHRCTALVLIAFAFLAVPAAHNHPPTRTSTMGRYSSDPGPPGRPTRRVKCGDAQLPSRTKMMTADASGPPCASADAINWSTAFRGVAEVARVVCRCSCGR